MRIASALGLVVALSACQVVLGEDFAGTEHYCDPLANTGCAAGSSCQISADRHPTCVADGSGALGSDCSTSGCAAGLTCFASALERECRRACRVGGDDCGASAACVEMTNVDGVAIGICLDHCDLARPDLSRSPFVACPIGKRCAVTTEDVTSCFTDTGIGGDGDPCGAGQKCKLGHTCATYSSGSAVCEPFCRVGAADCPPKRTCGKFKTALVIDGVEFGSCNSQ